MDLTDGKKAPLDMLARPLVVGDFVVYYNNIYEILEIKQYAKKFLCKLILVRKSLSTTTSRHNAKDLCLIDKNDVLIWKLKG
jgi:hypothetical protein